MTKIVVSEFVKLFNLVYDRKIGTDYFDWRFSAESNTQGFFSLAGDELRGCIGLQVTQVNDFRVGLVVDAMVHPEHRGSLTLAYLNNQMEKYARANDIKALVMLPNKQGAHTWSGDKDWKLVTQIATYECDNDYWTPYNSPPLLPYTTDAWIAPVHLIADRFKWFHSNLAIVKRDEQYLRWRFTDNPFHHYSAYIICDGQFFGYAVLKTFTDPCTDVRTGDIVDILWIVDDPRMLKKTLRALMHFPGINKVTTWLQTNTMLDDIGRDMGFVETDRKRDFMVKVLDENYAWLHDPTRWYLTMSDSEMY
jgi:hypothetical protein